MKETKQIVIPGFTSDLTPRDKPSMCVFAMENCGTTRFGTTLPEPIGWIPLDKNSLRTANEYKLKGKLDIITPAKPLIDNAKERELAMLDSSDPVQLKKIQAAYTEMLKYIDEAVSKLVNHPDVASIVVDKASQYFEMVIFSHFGRKNQIKPLSRGAANQDCINFIYSMSSKNSLLICKAKDIWADTGKVDKEGNAIREPNGKFDPAGFALIGGFVSATMQLKASHDKVRVDLDPDNDEYEENLKKALDAKYRAMVWKCKGNPLLEGQDLGKQYGICGEEITWSNVMRELKVR